MYFVCFMKICAQTYACADMKHIHLLSWPEPQLAYHFMLNEVISVN